MVISEINIIISFISTASGYERLGAGFITKRDSIESYAELLKAAIGSGVIDKKSADQLLLLAKEKPEQARGAKDRAIRFRDMLYELLRCGVDGSTPNRDTVESFNAFIAGPGKIGIGISEPSGALPKRPYSRIFLGNQEALLPFLPRISEIAFLLMTSPAHMARLKLCSGKTCGRIFFDGSKNGSKKWCSMRTCGNRKKAARHREAHKDTKKT